MNFSSIDIFCQVIDNFGDVGVVVRFAREFKIAHQWCNVRVFVDNPDTLNLFIPELDPHKPIQEFQSIQYIHSTIINEVLLQEIGIAEVLVEAFACQIPQVVMDMAYDRSALLINLEYLSAEDWVEGYHLKESLLPKGTLKKFFFMPGFTTSTGGMILNSELEKRRSDLMLHRHRFLQQILNQTGNEETISENQLVGTVFTYEHGFDRFIKDLAGLDKQVCLLVFGQKSKTSMLQSLRRISDTIKNQDRMVSCKNITIHFPTFLPQHMYDSLLCCSDFNLVRGEDSFARAVCAGKPFIWNAYIQDEKYQLVKVQAFLKRIQEYYDDKEVFKCYQNLLIQFNSASLETPYQVTEEQYGPFFNDLNKIEHAMMRMSYFIRHNCNLVKNFSEFISTFQVS